MSTTRRSILATLFAAPLAKSWPKSNVGPLDSRKYADELPKRPKWISRRPCAIPLGFNRSHIERLSLEQVKWVYSCCSLGNEHPRVISVSPQAWRDIWLSLSPMDRYVVMDSELANAGWQTFAFEDAEIVCDQELSGNEMWFINPSKKDDPRYNLRLTYGSSGIAPRPYVPPTEDEVSEWGEEFESYECDPD